MLSFEGTTDSLLNQSSNQDFYLDFIYKTMCGNLDVTPSLLIILAGCTLTSY